MNNLQVFNNNEFGEIRTIEINNKPYFCGSDVAKALGYAIPSKAINTHCKGVSKMEVPTKGGVQEMLFISVLQDLKKEREEKAKLEGENKMQKQIIGELQPKANYTDVILNNKGLVTITQIAKDYGKSGTEMNNMLHDLGVQYKQSGQWLLYSKYHDKGYTHSNTVDITRSDGSKDVKMNTKWTQKGRLFIYNLLKDNEIYPLIEK